MISYAVRSPSGTWSAVQQIADAPNTYFSMALDSTGKPGVAYYDARNGDLVYSKYNGSSWASQVVDARRTAGLYPSIQFGAGNRPVIAYYHSTYQELRFAAFNGTAWQISAVDGSADVGRYASLALNPSSGRWAIGYVDS